MAGAALLDHFSALDDPRQRGKVVYPLPEIMRVVLCATLAGAEDFVEVRFWGCEKLAFLRTMLPFKHGIPSHDMLNDVMNALDPELFCTCFTAWADDLREDAPDIVALDGRLLARAVRAHWGIENRLHWVLDVVFHDDLMRLRTDNGPRNMSTIKHMAMNLIRAAPGKDSLKVRRKAAGQTRTTFGASSPGPLADLQARLLMGSGVVRLGLGRWAEEGWCAGESGRS